MNQNYKLLATLLAFFMLTLTASAAEKTLGYCDDEFPADPYAVGVNTTSAIYVGAAIKVPASVMSSLKGNTISKIRIGVRSGMTNVIAWIREGALSTLPKVKTSVASTVTGWNEIEFETPYEITGEELYIGYNGRQPASQYCMLLDKKADNENATFIYDATDGWNDYYGQGWGCLLIQATVTGDNFASKDMAIESLSFDNDYYKAGETAKISLKLTNQGVSDCEDVAYSYEIDGGTPVKNSLSGTFASSTSQTFSHEISTEGLSDGVHTVRAYLDRSSIEGDEVSSNDTIEAKLLVYEKVYGHVVLLEHFTTIPCVNCPYGDRTLSALCSGRGNVAWVAHHAGYGTDELTITASQRYSNTFNGVGAPAGMFDRTYIEAIAYNSMTTFAAGYGDATYGADLLGVYFDQQAAVPAFVGMGVTSTYDETTRQLSINIDGSCNGIFQSLEPETYLTVFLVEDNVTAKTVQTGTSDDYTHDHVCRAVVTDTYGDELTWDGTSFAKTYTATLADGWKPEDLSIVAFVHKAYNSSDLKSNGVLNTAVCKVSEGSGIAAPESSKARVAIENGQVRVFGNYDSIAVYDASGAQVGTTGLAHGMYIVKTTQGGKNVTTKLVY